VAGKAKKYGEEKFVLFVARLTFNLFLPRLVYVQTAEFIITRQVVWRHFRPLIFLKVISFSVFAGKFDSVS
jgi:hypothetical protein